MQSQASEINLELSVKLQPLFRSRKRYILLKGGRGSAKSWSIALRLIQCAEANGERILCVREIQNSIRDSVHRLLKDTIGRLHRDSIFNITDNSISSLRSTGEFIFKGLWNNENSLKSTEGIDKCWVEEGQSMSAYSLDILGPTIRKPNSQIIISYNPTNIDDPVHADLYLPAVRGERDDVEIIEINWRDNKYFPDVLRSEMEYDKRTDYDKYLHKWEGHCVAHSQAQIFYGKWEVKDFETPEAAKFLFGADWGFAADPTALVRMFIKDNDLYIDHEAYGMGVEINQYPKFFESVPESKKNKIVADSARPESISYVKNAGFFIVPARKGANSIEEGISRLKSFNKIYIHPRCKNTVDEFRFYCYKTDKRTGSISTIPEDKHNHIIDSIRYATEDVIIRRGVANKISGW